MPHLEQTVLVVTKKDDLEEDIQWIIRNLNKYLEPGKKKELILRWADNLEQLHNLNVFQQPITEISATIKFHLKSEGLNHALPYVHEVLPFKYKDIDRMTKEYREEWLSEEILGVDSSDEDAKNLLAVDCKKLNHQYISRLERTIVYLQQFKKNLETDTALEDKIPEPELEEYLIRWDGALNMLQEVLDGRDRVLPSALHLLFYGKAQATLNDAFAKYVLYIREFASITAKQAGKLLKGHVTKVELLYEPKNRMEARYAGFYGIQCEECGTWRISYKYNPDKSKFMLYCYANGHWNKVKTEPLGIQR